MSRQLAVQAKSVALCAQTVTGEVTFFASYVPERLERHSCVSWPLDAENAVLKATDPVTAAGAMASRPCRVEFMKALLAGIGENSERNDGRVPDFKAIDSMLASLAS